MTSLKGPLVRFGMELLGVGSVVFLVGYFPTQAMGGPAAISAMTVGLAVGLTASMAGAVFLTLAVGRAQLLIGTLGAMGIRLMVAGAAAVGALLCGPWERTPLLLWVVLGHLVFLIPDTRLALAVMIPNRKAAMVRDFRS